MCGARHGAFLVWCNAMHDPDDLLSVAELIETSDVNRSVATTASRQLDAEGQGSLKIPTIERADSSGRPIVSKPQRVGIL